METSQRSKKQVREWKQVKDEVQDLLYRTKINSKAFTILILTAIWLIHSYYKPDAVRIGIANACFRINFCSAYIINLELHL